MRIVPKPEKYQINFVAVAVWRENGGSRMKELGRGTLPLEFDATVAETVIIMDTLSFDALINGLAS